MASPRGLGTPGDDGMKKYTEELLESLYGNPHASEGAMVSTRATPGVSAAGRGGVQRAVNPTAASGAGDAYEDLSTLSPEDMLDLDVAEIAGYFSLVSPVPTPGLRAALAAGGRQADLLPLKAAGMITPRKSPRASVPRRPLSSACVTPQHSAGRPSGRGPQRFVFDVEGVTDDGGRVPPGMGSAQKAPIHRKSAHASALLALAGGSPALTYDDLRSLVSPRHAPAILAKRSPR